MGTIVDDVIPIIDEGRTLIAEAGLRPVRLTVRVRLHDSPLLDGVGAGDSTFTDTPIVTSGRKPFKVGVVTPRDIIASGGKYTDAEYKVGPITPPYPGGGYTLNDLIPPQGANPKEVFYGIDDPTGVTKWCKSVGMETISPFGWFIYLKATGMDDP